jgi:hypothetical protein
MKHKAIIAALVVIGATVVLVVACGQKAGDERPTTGTDPQATNVPGSLHGTVRTPDGKPVANALVAATSNDDPPAPVPELAIVTDDEGRYEWPLRPGRYRLTVDVAGIGKATGDTTIENGTEPVLDLTVNP